MIVSKVELEYFCSSVTTVRATSWLKDTSILFVSEDDRATNFEKAFHEGCDVECFGFLNIGNALEDISKPYTNIVAYLGHSPTHGS